MQTEAAPGPSLKPRQPTHLPTAAHLPTTHPLPTHPPPNTLLRWSKDRLNYDADEYIEGALTDRLNKCQAANLTVISAAGLGLPSTREQQLRMCPLCAVCASAAQ